MKIVNADLFVLRLVPLCIRQLVVFQYFPLCWQVNLILEILQVTHLVRPCPL